MADLSQITVFELWLKAFLLGVALGLLYDGIRFLRMICGVRYPEVNGWEKPPSPLALRVMQYILIFLSDVFFCLTFGASSLLLLYNVAGGIFRLSIYPMILSGLFIYYISIGKMLLFLSSRIIILLGRLMRTLMRLISVPLGLIKRFFIFLYHLTIGKIVDKIKEERILRAKKREQEQAFGQAPLRDGEEESDGEERIYKRDGRISFGP